MELQPLNSDHKPRILLVEDERSLAALYAQYLSEIDVEVEHVCTGQEALDYLDGDIPDAILLDIRLPDMLGTEVLRSINDRKLPTATIMITAHGSINTAVNAMQRGAHDFLVKPFNRTRLIQTLHAALHKRSLQRQIMQKRTKHHDRFESFIGSSRSMQLVYRMIESASKSRAPVFISGESGTGKEIAALGVHNRSKRKDKPFIILNCAAIPKDRLESEIFGHVKGAFTGAITDHDGAALQADGGTLFLDEICEMDVMLQSKLLRFTQTGTFHKLGSSKEEKVDIRFVSATNRDPLEEIGAGRLREDLYYRLHVISIHMPPLRARGEDIIALAEHFLCLYAKEEGKQFKAFDYDARERLLSYAWPGNVRQLQNIVRTAVVLYDAEEMGVTMLPPPLDSTAAMQASIHSMARVNLSMAKQMGVLPAPQPITGYQAQTMPQTPPQMGGFTLPYEMEGRGAPTQKIATHAQTPPPNKKPTGNSNSIKPLWETEKEAIMCAISSCDGNIPKAAAILGISASTIYRKKQTWEQQEKRLARRLEQSKQQASL